MEYLIDSIFMNIYVKHEDYSYNVEYEMELTDTNVYMSGIGDIICHESGELVDYDSPLYEEICGYVFDLEIKISVNA